MKMARVIIIIKSLLQPRLQPCRLRLFNSCFIIVLCLTNMYQVGSTDEDPNSCSTRCNYQHEFLNANCQDLDLTLIPPIAGLCRAAKTLDLKNNMISQVHSNDLFEYMSIQFLYLGFNDIDTIPSNMCGNASGLKQLQLNNNNIRSISTNAFQYLHSVVGLQLDVNVIEDFQSGAFNGLTSLHTLQLNDNNISVLPSGVFVNLASLTILNLDNNALTQIPEEAFTGLNQLESLSLKKNMIATITLETFQSLINLKRIFLDGNNITSIDASLFRGLALETMSLANNDISTIKNLQELLGQPTTLTTFVLSGNPLHCDCELEPLRMWLQEKGPDTEPATCASPAEYQGMQLIDIKQDLCNGVVGLTSPRATSQSRHSLGGIGGSRKSLTNDDTWKIIIVACVVFLALAALVGGFMLIKKRRESRQQEQETDSVQYSTVQVQHIDNPHRRRITSETQLMADDSSAYESYTIPPDARGPNGLASRRTHPHAPLVKQLSTGSVTTSPDIAVATPDANTSSKPIKFATSEPDIPELELEFDENLTCTSLGDSLNSSSGSNRRRNTPPQYPPPPPPSTIGQQHVFASSPAGTNTGYLPLPILHNVTT